MELRDLTCTCWKPYILMRSCPNEEIFDAFVDSDHVYYLTVK
jgi:hypothetical protein